MVLALAVGLLAAGCAGPRVVFQASNDGGPFYFVGVSGGPADLTGIEGMDLTGRSKSHGGEGRSGGGGCSHGGCSDR